MRLHQDMVLQILEKTNDGRALFQTPAEIERHGRNGDGWQLKLCQDACNNWLTTRGKLLFEKLHAQIMNDDAAYGLSDFIDKFCPEFRDPERKPCPPQKPPLNHARTARKPST